ncbi:MAG: hypothetical protein KIT72_06395 [Polyangiaceae bacterium]|nr:hypothetical protein [Polyangiaceae bacterium]
MRLNKHRMTLLGGSERTLRGSAALLIDAMLDLLPRAYFDPRGAGSTWRRRSS